MRSAVTAVRSSRRFTLMMGMVVLLAFSFLLTRPQTAMAATLKKSNCIFYTDASLTVYSGSQAYRCNGSVAQTVGTVTAYSNCYYDYCCGNVWC
jgi:hypothetical protein